MIVFRQRNPSLFNENGSIVITICWKEELQKICLWDVQTGKLLKECTLDNQAACVLLHPDGNALLYTPAVSDKIIRFWGIHEERIIKEEQIIKELSLKKYSDSVLFSSDGNDMFVLEGATNEVYLWRRYPQDVSGFELFEETLSAC